MNRSSLRIGSIMGIPIYLHFSFLLILPFLAWSFGNNFKAMAALAEVPAAQLAWSPYAWGLAMAVLLFGSVLLHELGHSYVATKKDVSIRGITLMLFGGVAQLESMPSGPGEEAQVAIAGPVVSFAVGAGCYLASGTVGAADPNLVFALSYLGYMNVVLGFFNLLPAFPMDGGRILRSLLARKRSFVSATHIAATVGKVFAFAFGAYALVSWNVVLLFIAWFVYMGASQEYELALLRATLDGFRVRDLMSSPVATVTADMPLGQLVERMMTERHTGYPVTRDGRVVGCVTMEDLEKVEAVARPASRVADVMSGEPVTVHPDDDIYVALNRMTSADIGRVMVMEDDRLVGILSRSDVMRGFHLNKLRSVG